MAGAHRLLEALRAAPPPRARILSAPCMGACDQGPGHAAEHGGTDGLVTAATPARVAAAWLHGVRLTPPARPPAPPMPVLAPPPDGRLTRRRCAALDAAGLQRPRRPAFPPRKWRAVMTQPGRATSWSMPMKAARHLQGPLVPAPSSSSRARRHADRGTGDRRRGLLDLPARRIPRARHTLATAIAAAAQAGVAQQPIHLRRGAGTYICGEETALLESLEGRRAIRATSRPTGRGRPLWPPDADPQCRDAVVAARTLRHAEAAARYSPPAARASPGDASYPACRAACGNRRA